MANKCSHEFRQSITHTKSGGWFTLEYQCLVCIYCLETVFWDEDNETWRVLWSLEDIESDKSETHTDSETSGDVSSEL